MVLPLVSVILPAYNVEQYIAQCIESILQQSYTNLEIIVVIDGSPDRSLEIAQKYALKDNRIRVISQDNTGSGPARNNGLNNSTGEFIVFVDPDDWIEPDYIETLINIQKIDDYDLVIVGNHRYIFEGSKLIRTNIKKFTQNSEYNTIDVVRSRYLTLRFKDKFADTPWGKLYKRSIIDKYKLRFPDLKRSQDIYFNTLYYNQISSLYESTYSGYCYRDILGDRSVKKTDYYITAHILYKQLCEMYNDWRIELDNDLVLSVFVLNIISNYERILLRKESIEDFENNTFVQLVTLKGNPTKFIHKFELFCLKYHLHTVTKIILKLKNTIKKI